MKRRILFIDRDGTLIKEPADEQVDDINKVDWIPGVMGSLERIKRLRNDLFVMVTNQDGLGTDSFPEDQFWPIQNLVVRTLESQGIVFDDICIDPHRPEDNSPTRKPEIGLVKGYLKADYDIENSYVIGDRLSDVQFAKNIGCKSILISEKEHDDADYTVQNWSEIESILLSEDRVTRISRNTKETKIDVTLNLDGSGRGHINTGLPFFDHMLDQLVRHGQIDLDVSVQGDLEIDEHHTIEDTGIALGQAFYSAIKQFNSYQRYGFALPMDDCSAQVLLDFGGRPWIEWSAEFKREKIGDMPTEMFYHFFKSWSDHAKANLNITAFGDNEHHKIEAIFKAWARAIKAAVQRDAALLLPSTKGML